MLLGTRGGDGSSAVPTGICELWRSGFACLRHTQPNAVSNQVGREFDTSSADPPEAGRNPHSTSQRKRTLHDRKNRLPAAFPAICHRLVRDSVVGGTASQHHHTHSPRKSV